MKKIILCFLLCTLYFFILPAPCIALEEDVHYDALLEALPEEYAEYFLNGEGRVTLPTLPDFLALCFDSLRSVLLEGTGSLKHTMALILLCSLFTMLEKSFREQRAAGALRICVLLSGLLCIGQALPSLFSLASAHLEKLSGFLSGLLPILSSINLAMGGVNSATVCTVAISVFLSLTGEWCLGLLFPLQKICFAFDLTALICENTGLSSLAGSIKKMFLFLLSGISAFILAVFAFQNLVAAKTDSAALRAFRFTAGGFVPMVGSALSESSKTLSAGLDLIRSTVGAVAVISILLMLLVPLSSLFVYSILFSFSSSFAKALENDLLSSLFSIASSTVNGLIALIILCDLPLILCLAISLSSTIA